MKLTTLVRATAVVSSTALLSLTASPALAAEPVARASATGLVLGFAGNPSGTGSYAVSNDGSGETTTGSNQPALGLLGNQRFVSAGTLAQDATTAVTNGDGTSAACAGLAGRGASLVAAGNGSCLAGGSTLDLTPTALDLSSLSTVSLVQNDLFTQAQTQLLDALGPLDPSAAALTQLQAALDQALAPLAGAGLVLSAGAIQSRCTATPTSADGTANLAGAGASLTLPGRPAIPLATFPANPAPNTQAVVDLDVVLNNLLGALRTSLETSAASGPLAPVLAPIVTALGVPLSTLQDQLVTGVIGQVSDQLAPLNENVVTLTLNKQTRSSANQITVTALELSVLPVAAEQLGGAPASAQIGTSSCGPNGRVPAPSVAPVADRPRENDPPARPAVPTSVPAGYESAPPADAPLGPVALAALGALLALSIATGTAVYRRRARG